MSDCTACGLPRATAEDHATAIATIPAIVAAVGAHEDLSRFYAYRRCWFRSDEACREWQAAQKAERRAMAPGRRRYDSVVHRASRWFRCERQQQD